MTTDADTATLDDATTDADFDAGFSGTEVKIAPPPARTERPDPAATPRVEEEPKPEYVQITAKDWADIKAAAAKTASYDQQLSKAFGTIGNLQKIVNGFQEKPPAARKVEIPKDAFAQMERDFPELAQQTRSALEAALSGVSGAHPEVDATKIETMLASYTSRREVEALEDAHPDWRTIVGAVDASKEQPDPNNPFRKWLQTKDAAYQAKVNGSESAAVISRAIRTFQNETKAPAKPATTPRDTARAERIRGAVQPKGDNAGGAPSKTEDDDFLAGFNSR